AVALEDPAGCGEQLVAGAQPFRRDPLVVPGPAAGPPPPPAPPPPRRGVAPRPPPASIRPGSVACPPTASACCLSTCMSNITRLDRRTKGARPDDETDGRRHRARRDPDGRRGGSTRGPRLDRSALRQDAVAAGVRRAPR